MATAESHVSAMQKQRSELANIQSVAQLFRQRAGTDAQRTAARRKISGARLPAGGWTCPGRSWPGRAKKPPGV